MFTSAITGYGIAKRLYVGKELYKDMYIYCSNLTTQYTYQYIKNKEKDSSVSLKAHKHSSYKYTLQISQNYGKLNAEHTHM